MIKSIKYFLIFLFLLSCGYSPIYQTNEKVNFKLDIIDFSGDKEIGREIIKSLEKFKEGENSNIFDLNLNIDKREIIVTKNKKGDPSSFKTTIEVNLDLFNQTNQKVIKRKFVEEITYDSMENKFELNQYKNKLEKNMVFKIVQDLGIFFSVIQNDM
tara:strand:+ start:687 stop:1157 length:471 start_codon:yes stop_codon:yes gene_type:complete